jgi:hypothetical protein
MNEMDSGRRGGIKSWQGRGHGSMVIADRIRGAF